MPDLYLLPRGNLGNQMLQLIYATSLQDRVPGLQIRGYDMKLWHLSRPGAPRWEFLTPSLHLHKGAGQGVEDLFRSGALARAKLRDVPLTCDLFAPPARFASLFPLVEGQAPSTGADELLINVRGDEILKAAHSGYGPVPLGWYDQLIASTGLRPVFLGQLSDDYYSDLLRRRYPAARFVPSRGILEDFTAIRLARHIAISVSTFSWLAAWMSGAETIHLPMLGIFNPAQRPDVWMLPQDDPRYRFYQFPRRDWQASEAQRAALSAPMQAPELTPAALTSLRAATDLARKPAIAAARRKLGRLAILSRLPMPAR